MNNNSTNSPKKIEKSRREMLQYINLQLASIGQPIFSDNTSKFLSPSASRFLSLTDSLVKNFQEKSRLLSGHYSPVDRRIQNFINAYLKELNFNKPYTLPDTTLILNQPGMAREVSLPPNDISFKTNLVSSYRLHQGILHNPAADKRTTKGTFHIVEGGLPVPFDKKEVPKITFAHMLHSAVNPDSNLNLLPFTANQKEKAKTMVSLLLRPTVCPEVKGVLSGQSMEIRFFAPGSLVSNLDFVETIFGNAGDPNLAENDAALDIEHWTGHTGCIILAPQLTKLKKKDIGLPNYNDASERQKAEGMCWKGKDELYNEGNAFKITCRNDKGIVVTLIADNYYGYSKKEIKTQISYSANLLGLVEEEHAGGAIAFPGGKMGDTIFGKPFSEKFKNKYSFEEVKKLLKEKIEVMPENYAIDKKYPNIIYIHEHANIDINKGTISWLNNNKEQNIKLSPKKVYIHPTGHKFELAKHPEQQLWQIIDTAPEGIFCHKPSTVSGGGKSEISKSMGNAIKYGEFYIHDLEKDSEMVDTIINYNYSYRWQTKYEKTHISRSFLSSHRTLGSAVKLLTPSDQYSNEYNHFLETIPARIKTLALYIKQMYRTHQDKGAWKDFLNVEIVNGRNGSALRYKHNKIMASYARIGFNIEGKWFLHKLRSDFIPCKKIQTEDDISVSVTLPSSSLSNLNKGYNNKSVKLVSNCENYFFQRPDEAIIRGYDKIAEIDITTPNTFLTNYEPLTHNDANNLYEDSIHFDEYTSPVKNFIKRIVKSNSNKFFVIPSHPRLVNGVATKNPRYLQRNIFKQENQESHVAEIGIRLFRKIEISSPVFFPVNAVLPGRRNNPPDRKKGIRPLSVYNPIHYQETPELFMDFICSLTGKSPSTTGAGSEGALTKGPFNMLIATTDLNNALLSMILTGYQGFSSAAGYIGSNKRFDHDISILIPEIWARLEQEDRDANNLIKNKCLEKLEDFEYNGKIILASRLGYRINKNFAFRCMNKLFDEPLAVFNENMLKPELQNMNDFVDGINNIVEAQEKVAIQYFRDGSIKSAIPPLKILLNIMAYGSYKGYNINNKELRKEFTREHVIQSEWYNERLRLKQKKDIEFIKKQIKYLKNFIATPNNQSIVNRLNLNDRLNRAIKKFTHYKSPDYYTSLIGTIGADPLFYKK